MTSRKSRGLLIPLLSAALLSAATISCETKKTESSEKIAKKENDENFDTKEGEKVADFVVEAVEQSYGEIRLAQLAINKSTDDEVKEIAGLIEKDHADDVIQLKGLANKKGIAIPLEETDKAEKVVANLSNQDQGEFNKKWCKEMAKEHEKAIQHFEKTWEKTDDPDLKEWINGALPDLRTHLVKLNSCHERLDMRASK